MPTPPPVFGSDSDDERPRLSSKKDELEQSISVPQGFSTKPAGTEIPLPETEEKLIRDEVQSGLPPKLKNKDRQVDFSFTPEVRLTNFPIAPVALITGTLGIMYALDGIFTSDSLKITIGASITLFILIVVGLISFHGRQRKKVAVNPYYNEITQWIDISRQVSP